MPSLPAMAHLEKEIKTLNDKVCEFDYSAEYLDDMFDGSGSASTEHTKLDLLLAT